MRKSWLPFLQNRILATWMEINTWKQVPLAVFHRWARWAWLEIHISSFTLVLAQKSFYRVFGKNSKSDKSIDENDAKKLVAIFTKSDFGHINGDKYVKTSPISRFSPLSTMSMVRNSYILVLAGFWQKNQNDAKKLVANFKMMRKSWLPILKNRKIEFWPHKWR